MPEPVVSESDDNPCHLPNQYFDKGDKRNRMRDNGKNWPDISSQANNKRYDKLEESGKKPHFGETSKFGWERENDQDKQCAHF